MTSQNDFFWFWILFIIVSNYLSEKNSHSKIQLCYILALILPICPEENTWMMLKEVLV